MHVAFSDSATSLHDDRVGEPLPLRERQAALAAAIGLPVWEMRQVHGSEVVVIDDWRSSTWPPTCDAMISTQPGQALITRVADCVPILVADAERGLIAAVHAGRVGMAAGVIEQAIATMQHLGLTQWSAWIGPHACGRCYEVPEQMREDFSRLHPAARSTTSWGTPALDLGAAAQAVVTALGGSAIRVPGCTIEEDRWHSHRRDGSAAGRFVGAIWREE